MWVSFIDMTFYFYFLFLYCQLYTQTPYNTVYLNVEYRLGGYYLKLARSVQPSHKRG